MLACCKVLETPCKPVVLILLILDQLLFGYNLPLGGHRILAASQKRDLLNQ